LLELLCEGPGDAGPAAIVYPNVNTYASAPPSKRVISRVRSRTGS
jgi:hypothetical protein